MAHIRSMVRAAFKPRIVPQAFTTILSNGNPMPWWQVGDSITRGQGQSSTFGFRKADYQWGVSNGFNIVWTGTINGPGDWPNPLHNGVPGATIAGVDTIVTVNGPTHATGIVQVMCGVNDCNSGIYNPVTTPAALLALWNKIASYYGCYLLVSNITPSSDPTGAPAIADFNTKIPALVASYNAAHVGREAFFADANAALGGVYTPALMADAVHPNDAGYAALAAEYQATLSAPPI